MCFNCVNKVGLWENELVGQSKMCKANGKIKFLFYAWLLWIKISSWMC